METKTFGISGSTLKFIALGCMIIDHIGASVLERLLVTDYSFYTPYMTCRFIGRIAFPIYCFLLVEGLEHTKSVGRYALNLFLFALISEVPFNLAFYGSVLQVDPAHFLPQGLKDTHQNVFFTLLIGLLMLVCIRRLEDRSRWPRSMQELPEGMQRALVFTLTIAVALPAAGLAAVLHTDYNAWGIATILVIYRLRKLHKILAFGGGCGILTLMNTMEATSFFGLFPIAFYNGKRGIRLKYFFYLAYPVHLSILYLVCILLNIA